MENPIQKTPSRLVEAVLWSLANILLVCFAIGALYAAKTIFEWSSTQWVLSAMSMLLLSATWGSWAALTWTHHRALRALMVVVTLMPGLLLMAFGGWAFFAMPENRWVWKWGWLIVVGHGVGAVAMAAMLGGSKILRRTSLAVRRRRLLMGWTVFPLLLSIGSVALVAVIAPLLPDFVNGGDQVLEMLLRWIIPSQAVILFTTGLPAGCAQLCQALSPEGSEG